MVQRLRGSEDDRGVAGPPRHHCHIVETGNESYRITHATATTKKRIRAREQDRKEAKASSLDSS